MFGKEYDYCNVNGVESKRKTLRKMNFIIKRECINFSAFSVAQYEKGKQEMMICYTQTMSNVAMVYWTPMVFTC